MNFKIIDNKSFVIKLNNSYKKITLDNQNKIIKELLILVRKRYSYNICGLYEIDIYKSNMFSILMFRKTNNDSGIYNNIDLKIKNHSKELNITIDDYELLKKTSLKINELNTCDIYKICEHYSFNV